MLQYKTIEHSTLELLKSLMERDFLQQFVLVGGSALSLHLGHRKSIDLDLFTLSDFNSEDIVQYLLKDYSLLTLTQLPQTLISEINGIKVDFIRFRYPFIRPVLIEDGIRLLTIDDIAPMKLDAITGRGLKKDFFDLYYLLEIYTIDRLLELYLEKYQHQSTFHVIRSLTYFVDAEKDPNPFVFDKQITWVKVKKRIISEIKKI
jgi:predicted nucleotidyltransferase component of viral defense system